jgi:hypothetical protein
VERLEEPGEEASVYSLNPVGDKFIELNLDNL